MLLNFLKIFTFLGQQKRLGEQDEMLMPVQLPYILVVADLFEIEVWHPFHVAQGRGLVVRIVLSPVDVEPGTHGQAEQRKPVGHDFSSEPVDLISVRRVLQLGHDRPRVRQAGQWSSGLNAGRRSLEKHGQIREFLARPEHDFTGTAPA